MSDMRKTGRPISSSLDRMTPENVKPMVRQLRLILDGMSADIRMLFNLTNAIKPVTPNMAASLPGTALPGTPGTTGSPGADGAPGVGFSKVLFYAGMF